MGYGNVAAMLCIHLLVWSTCNATVNRSLRGSDDILIRNAQPIKSAWRKLLQDNSSAPDPRNAETPKADMAAEPDDVNAVHSDAEDERKAGVNDVNAVHSDAERKAGVKEENVVLVTETEMPKDSRAEDAGKGEVKEKNVVPDAEIGMSSTDTISPSVSIEEFKSSGAFAAMSVPDEDDAQIPIVKEKGHGTQEEPKEEASSKSSDGDPIITEMNNTEKAEEVSSKSGDGDPTTTEKAEDSTPLASGKPQDVQVEENTTGGTGEVGEAEIPQKKAEVEQQIPSDNVIDLDSGQTEEVQAQIVPVKEEDLKEKNHGEEGHMDVSTVGMRSELPEAGKDDELQVGEMASTVETVTMAENTEGLSEGNPNTAMETDSDENRTGSSGDAEIKMVVENARPDSDERARLALDLPVAASVEENGSSNKADGERQRGKNEEENPIKESVEVGLQVENEKEGGAMEEKVENERKGGAMEEKVEAQDKEDGGHDAEEISRAKSDDDGDDETQAMAKEVETQLEALKRDTILDTSTDNHRRDESDRSTDDDNEYDIIQGIVDLPIKFHETAEKVADHLGPDLRRWSDTSKQYFNRANQQISESFSPLIGRQYAPFLALMISYGVLLLPLLVVILLFDHIKALFSLQKVLLFINVYLAAYFATLWLASFIIGLEPMSFFYHNSLSSYLSLQLLQASGYGVYLMLQAGNAINSCAWETRVGQATSWLQWAVAAGIGLHYYVTVFHPAVTGKPPHTSWKFYAAYSAAFCVLCFSARIRWVKKEYLGHGNAVACNKKS